MKAMIGVAILVGALLAYASFGIAAEQPAAPVPVVSTSAPPAQASSGPEPAAPAVPMVELILQDNSVVTGRLVKEDDRTVQVTSFGGSSIGYGRDLIQTVRRYELQPGEFAEQAGDYQAGQIWKATNPAGAYAKARDQYQQALLLAADGKERERVQGKVADLERERDALQAEALRQSEVQKAKDEADLVRLQKQLTQKQVVALQALGPRLRQLEQGLRQTNQVIVAVQNGAANNSVVLDALGRQLAKVQDELTNLEYNVIYAPYPAYVDPRRPHDNGGRGDDHRDRDGNRDEDENGNGSGNGSGS